MKPRREGVIIVDLDGGDRSEVVRAVIDLMMRERREERLHVAAADLRRHVEKVSVNEPIILPTGKKKNRWKSLAIVKGRSKLRKKG